MSYPPHGLTAEVLGLDPSIPNVDKAVDRAVAYARRIAGWHIFPVISETLKEDGEGGHVLTLPTLHVEDVTEIRENGHVLDSETYEWSATGDVKRVGRCWTTRWRGIEVTLSHGYSLEDAALADFIEALVSAVNNAAANPMGIPEVIGPFQLTGDTSQGWIGDAGRTLAHFTLPPRA